MSAYLVYQAIPATSALLAGLRSDVRLARLFNALFLNDSPFEWEHADPEWDEEEQEGLADEREDLLDALAEDHAFGDRATVDAVLAQLLELMREAEHQSPGIADHAVAIQEEGDDALENLKQEVERRGDRAELQLLDHLIHGAGSFSPDAFGPHEDHLTLVEADEVAVGSALLQRLGADAVIGAGTAGEGALPGDQIEGYARWWAFYLDAARHGDAVLCAVM